MKLTEFNNKPTLSAKKALKENFNTSLNFDNLSMSDTRTMLRKVKGLISETRQSNAIHSSEDDEEEELAKERNILASSEKLKALSYEAYQALIADDTADYAAPALKQLARAAAATGDHSAAMVAWRTLLQLDVPERAEVHFQLARLLHQRAGATDVALLEITSLCQQVLDVRRHRSPPPEAQVRPCAG